MEEVIFVVNVQDFAYRKPIVKIEYAGKSAERAYEKYNRAVASDDRNHRITLELVEGAFSTRLATHDHVMTTAEGLRIARNT